MGELRLLDLSHLEVDDYVIYTIDTGAIFERLYFGIVKRKGSKIIVNDYEVHGDEIADCSFEFTNDDEFYIILHSKEKLTLETFKENYPEYFI